jgi:phospholipase/carboxylesterase
VILLHGRGASADSILSLGGYLNVDGYALLAPQATNHTWYPNSFLAPVVNNEPWLSSALALVKELVADVQSAGIAQENIFFVGFSQGACLTLEFAMRNAAKYGGIAAFTGGVIGNKINTDNYSGDFGGAPVFLGSSDPDPHIPVERVYATSNLLKNRNADVTEKIYPNMGHTISEDEIAIVNRLIFI